MMILICGRTSHNDEIVLGDGCWDIYLSAAAHLTLLGPIIENYRKETGGIILGSISREWIDGTQRPIIRIESVIPSLTAESTNKSWRLKPASYNRMIGFAKGHNLEILGEYHSHPNGDLELSKADREYIRMQPKTKWQ